MSEPLAVVGLANCSPAAQRSEFFFRCFGTTFPYSIGVVAPVSARAAHLAVLC